METIALTVMLIQIALDTHDFVKNDDEEIESMEVQQLTVLAGDFYSGLYYKELSYLPNIHLIRCLAEAIKIINENKIRVYQREITTFEDFMHSMKIIETSLYKKSQLT